MTRVALMAIALTQGPALAAQSAEDFYQQPTVTSAAISPNGLSVAYVTREADMGSDRWRYVIRIIAAAGGEPRPFADGTSPAWAPDGSALAFRTPVGNQLAVQQVNGGEARVLTALPSGVDGFRWSRDGSRLAFVAVPARTPGGLRLFRGSDRGSRVALHIVPTAGGEVRQLTDPARLAIGPSVPGTSGVLEFDWLDSTSLVLSGRALASGEPSDAASLFRIDASTGENRYIAGAGGRWHAPVVSPDGQWIAFTGYPVTRLGYVPEELVILRPNGTGLKRLTVGLDRDVGDVHWSTDNRTLWFATDDRGTRNIQRVNIRNSRIELPTAGTHVLTLGDVARTGDFGVALRSIPSAPAGLVRFPLNRPSQFTWLVDNPIIAGLGEVEEFEFRARDGAPIHAWLLRPPRFETNRRWPLLVEVHGGPHAMAAAGYAPTALAAAAAGWLVLRVNPRGSTGFGSDHANGLGREWPGADAADIADALADVVLRGLADSTQIVVFGMGSGGVTVATLLEQVGAVRAGILSCVGNGWLRGGSGNDLAPWGEWGRSAPFHVMPESWLAGSLLVRGISSTKPVLVIEGTVPEPGPIDFSESYYSALVRRGAVTQFLRLTTPCDEIGPATQARVAEHARAWLTSLGAGS